MYGDSVSDGLGLSVLSRALCKTLYEGCIRSYQWIYPFINGYQNEDDDLDFRPEIVIENIQKVLNSPEMQREGSLMVLNNGLHYPKCQFHNSPGTYKKPDSQFEKESRE